jgi:hypothetical protein
MASGGRVAAARSFATISYNGLGGIPMRLGFSWLSAAGAGQDLY